MSDAWEVKACLQCGTKFKAQKWRGRKYCQLDCMYEHRRAATEAAKQARKAAEERAHQRNVEALEAYLRQRQERIAARERRERYGVIA